MSFADSRKKEEMNLRDGLLRKARHTNQENDLSSYKRQPSEWKVAKVIPLNKSGSLGEIVNYRPISILPTLYQFVFRPNRSTEVASTSLLLTERKPTV